MGKVKVLPDEVVSRIAAGEVIERPASVVKELLENALDADAKTVEIRIRGAGRSLIGIRDDGTGIEPDDLETIFLRHATSKIHRSADLYAILTYGFRGEALYSIASVSDVVVRSRTANSDSGWEMHARGAQAVSKKPVAGVRGTDIEVRELFFNTPARRKFLKADSTEFNRILSVVLPYAIACSSVRFALHHNDREILSADPVDSREQRIARALGIKPEHILTATPDFEGEKASVELYLGDINVQQSSRDMQFVFVNGRPVQHRAVYAVLNRVYRQIMPPDSQPFFAVFVNVPPEDVDVNVHPAKREVKLEREQALVARIAASAEQVLLGRGQARQVRGVVFSVERRLGVTPPPGLPVVYPIEPDISVHEAQEAYPGGPASVEIPAGSLREKLLVGRYIGNFAAKYLFFDTGASLLVVDQHAAHERITYERLLEQMNAGRVEIQHLLTPLLVRLTPPERLAWEEGKQRLEEAGFPSTQWDKETVAIHAYPVLIRRSEQAFRELLAGGEISRCDNATLARKACRYSVMAGEVLKEAEADSLRGELLRCKDPFACPHGRPTVIEMTEKFLDRQFLRV